MNNFGPPATIRLLTESDLAAVEQLCRIAGWNQIPADLKRLLAYEPHGCFAACIDSEVVGSVTTTTFGTDMAWIGMMLVHPDHRRRGIATALMETSLEYLHARSITCIKLDATPLGQPVYERLGFRPEWSFQRWRRDSDVAPTVNPTSDQRELNCDLDRIAFGADRSGWLRCLRGGSFATTDTDAFGLVRPGWLASYLGPIVARDRQVAAHVVDRLLLATGGPVFWDVPGPNSAATELARERSFEPVRDLVRMWLGERLVAGQPELQYAIAAPETG